MRIQAPAVMRLGSTHDSAAIRNAMATVGHTCQVGEQGRLNNGGVALSAAQQALVMESASGPWCMRPLLELAAASGARRGVGDSWILQPEDAWEVTGYVHNVVFTCGAVPEPDGTVKMYWAARIQSCAWGKPISPIWSRSAWITPERRNERAVSG